MNFRAKNPDLHIFTEVEFWIRNGDLEQSFKSRKAAAVCCDWLGLEFLHYLHLFYELTSPEPRLLQIRGEHEAIINSLSLSSIPLDIIKLPR